MRITTLPYAAWSSAVDALTLKVYHRVDGEGSRIAYAGDPEFTWKCHIDPDDFDTPTTGYNAKYETGATVISIEGEAIAKIVESTKGMDSRKKSYVTNWPTEGSRVTSISPNWARKTSWFYNSVRVVDEVATDSGDQLTYNLANSPIVDASHGHISDEDFLKDSGGNLYKVTVKVNDVVKAEHSPDTSDGDYGIDYSLGKVTFGSALGGGDVVKVTYHKIVDSKWCLKPAAGKILKLVSVEVQFSTDLVLTDSVDFQLKVGGSPYGDPKRYKNMSDFINEANGSLPVMPKMGGSGWRGMPSDMFIFEWDYRAITDLKSSLAMEVEISLVNDTPFTGSVATATFYCLSVADN